MTVSWWQKVCSYDKLRASYARLSEKYEDIEREKTDALDLCQTLTDKNKELQSSIDSMQSIISSEISRKDTEIRKLKNRIQKSKNGVGISHKERKNMLTRDKVNLLKATEENKSLNIENQRLKAEIDSLRKDNAVLADLIKHQKE